jgi:bis(5'-nucleosidyl)-tetraphosphatase
MPAFTKDHTSARQRSAGVVVLRRRASDWRCLLLRAFAYWDFPKGRIEADEAPLAAAIREVAEETGLAGLVFRWGEAFRDTAPYSGGKVARYYLAESPAGEVQPEHDEFRWVSFAVAKRLAVPRIRQIAEWAEGVVAGSP